MQDRPLEELRKRVKQAVAVMHGVRDRVQALPDNAPQAQVTETQAHVRAGFDQLERLFPVDAMQMAAQAEARATTDAEEEAEEEEETDEVEALAEEEESEGEADAEEEAGEEEAGEEEGIEEEDEGEWDLDEMARRLPAVFAELKQMAEDPDPNVPRFSEEQRQVIEAGLLKIQAGLERSALIRELGEAVSEVQQLLGARAAQQQRVLQSLLTLQAHQKKLLS
jgi:hypothetical protein